MIALGSPNVALWVLGKGYLVPATSSPLAFGESDVQLQGNQGAKALRPRPSWTVANMNPWYQKLGRVFWGAVGCVLLSKIKTVTTWEEAENPSHTICSKLPEKKHKKNKSWNPLVTFPSQSCHAVGTHNLETLQLPGAELSRFSGPSYVCQNYFTLELIWKKLLPNWWNHDQRQLSHVIFCPSKKSYKIFAVVHVFLLPISS